MKTADLLFVLNAAKTSLVGVDFIPILSHFCFAGDTVHAYDDVSAVIVALETGIKGAVKGDTLLGILGTCGEEVELVQKGLTLTIKTDTGDTDLPMLSEKEFLFKFPDDASSWETPLDDTFKEALSRCSVTVGRDPRRPEFIGITIMHGRGPGALFYSTDNISLSRYTVGEPKNINARAVLPKPAVEQALNLAKLTEEAPSLGMSGTTAIFSFATTPPIFVIARLMEFKGTDFEAVISQHSEGYAGFDVPADLERVIERNCVILNKSAEKNTTLSVNDKTLSINTETALGKAGTNLAISAKVPQAKVVVNAEMLRRVLSLATEMGVTERSICLRSDSFVHVISGIGTSK